MKELLSLIDTYANATFEQGLYPKSDDPIPEQRRDAVVKALGAALAAPQGHTREQIGLQLDDRREGLGAHHVYCRAVTEDV